jgi:hypothetical protein
LAERSSVFAIWPYSSLEIPSIKYVLTPSLANAFAVFAGPPPTTAICTFPFGIKSIKTSPTTHT